MACSALPADCPSEKLVGRARTSDAILILGGDGTFVGVGRKLAGLDIPLLGINFGQVGFLTELSAVGWEPALERLLAGKMITRTCLLLAWELLRGGTPIASGHAANDVVVGRGAIARVLPVHVFVDGEDMGVVRSDGVIVSTPLGSSAYALSAHGPLVHPKVQGPHPDAHFALLQELPAHRPARGLPHPPRNSTPPSPDAFADRWTGRRASPCAAATSYGCKASMPGCGSFPAHPAPISSVLA